MLTGVVDGNNTTFTVSARVYVSGTLRIRNGQLLTLGSDADWAETDPGSGLSDFVVAPVVSDRVTVGYKVPGAGSGDADTLDGLHAGELLSGWISVSDVWTYAGADNPVYQCLR